MPTSPFARLWSELATAFEELLADTNLSVPTQDREVIRSFVEHNEFGLAFEELLATIRGESLQLTPDQERAIVAIGEKMEFSPETWSDLNQR